MNNPVMWIGPSGLFSVSTQREGRYWVTTTVDRDGCTTTSFTSLDGVWAGSYDSAGWRATPDRKVGGSSVSSMTYVISAMRYVLGNGWHVDNDIFIGLGGSGGATTSSVTSSSIRRTGVTINTANSTGLLPNSDGSIRQGRTYDPDGNPVRDRDFNHGGAGHEFTHDHEWVDRQRQPGVLVPRPNPQGNNNATNVLLGGAGAYAAYRFVRMLPSLAPPLWWTIPKNVAIP